MITKVAFVGQPSRDRERSKRFYGDLLGLQYEFEHERWCEYQAPGGVAVALDGYAPEFIENPTPYLSLETDDLEADLARLQDEGVPVVMPLRINENAEGREICRMATVLDPDGNPIMLHQIAEWRRS